MTKCSIVLLIIMGERAQRPHPMGARTRPSHNAEVDPSGPTPRRIKMCVFLLQNDITRTFHGYKTTPKTCRIFPSEVMVQLY